MRKTVMTACAVALLAGCASEPKSDNPFFSEYTTPFQVPPFEQIKIEHYKPAYLKGMEEQVAEIDAIINNPETPNFENTIAALDQSGAL